MFVGSSRWWGAALPRSRSTGFDGHFFGAAVALDGRLLSKFCAVGSFEPRAA